MRALRWSALCAAFAGAGPMAGCRAIEGLDQLVFDRTLDGGAVVACPCGDWLPHGWSGPVAVYEGPTGTAPECPSDYPAPVLRGGAGLQADPAQCSACACGAPALSCTPGSIEAHSQSSCNGNKSSVSPADGSCAPFSPPGDYFVQAAPQANVGACAPTGGEVTLPPLNWTTEAVACGLAASAGACTCAPPAPDPFEARPCVFQMGVHACPEQFPKARGWRSLHDTRGCAPCTCGAPSSGAACTVTTDLFSDGQCTKLVAELGAPGQCGQASGVHSVLATASITGSPTCTPDGGSPLGSASTETALTVCCAP